MLKNIKTKGFRKARMRGAREDTFEMEEDRSGV